VRVLKLTIAYDGTDFVGWQRQAVGTSIQGLLEDALAAFEQGPVALHGAGRTDAGVHALAQVASVSLTATHEAGAIQRGLNAALPLAVRVVAAEDAPPGFHARFHASGKVYEYRIVHAPVLPPFLARYAWHVPQRLDLEVMRRAADRLVGRHDFAAFRGSRSAVRDTVRTVESIDWRGGSGTDSPLVVTLAADGFLRHMVRAIVGTLVDIGMGRWPADAVVEMLASRDRVRAGRTAPSQGLFLVRVRY
jgi:tRNA pseudouridine38-40 synthase